MPLLYLNVLSVEKPPVKAYYAHSYFFILASRNEILAHGVVLGLLPNFLCLFLNLVVDRLTSRYQFPIEKSWGDALRLIVRDILDLVLNLLILNAVEHSLDAIFRFLISAYKFQNQKDLHL